MTRTPYLKNEKNQEKNQKKSRRNQEKMKNHFCNQKRISSDIPLEKKRWSKVKLHKTNFKGKDSGGKKFKKYFFHSKAPNFSRERIPFDSSKFGEFYTATGYLLPANTFPIHDSSLQLPNSELNFFFFSLFFSVKFKLFVTLSGNDLNILIISKSISWNNFWFVFLNLGFLEAKN